MQAPTPTNEPGGEQRLTRHSLVDHTLTSAKTLRQAIAGLLPDVRQRADDAESARTVPAETMANRREAGLFRAFVPRLCGGDERTLAEVLDAVTDLAAACPSTAWVGTLFAMHNIATCWLERRGQDEIFADGPDVPVASSVAPMGTLVPAEGGFRLTGRWSFASGVEPAAWIMVGAHLEPATENAPMDTCSRTVLESFRGSGGGALRDANPLQRHFRDIHAMTQHVAMDTDRAGETYGRLLFQNCGLAFGVHDSTHNS